MASGISDEFTDLRNSRKKMRKFFPILDDFFMKFEKRLQASQFKQVVEEKVFKKVIDELKSQSKVSSLMFFIPIDLYHKLQNTDEFDPKLVRNESLAFLEWLLKFHLYLHSKATDASSVQSKEIFQILDDTICVLLEHTATNDGPGFTTFVQSYLKLINQLIEKLVTMTTENGIEDFQITGFSYYSNQIKSVDSNGLFLKSEISLKLDSVKKMELLFESVCKIFKRTKEFFILHLELSEDPKLGSKFLSNLLNNAFKLKNFKLRIYCLDLYFLSVGVETLEYFSNHSFLSLFSICSINFLNFSENDEEAESLLINGWKCLKKKVYFLDESLDDPTSMVIDIFTFLLKNICGIIVQNWNNDLFQQVIPEVFESFIRFCILRAQNTTQDLFKYLFDLFEANKKHILFKSRWITLIISVVVQQLTNNHSQENGSTCEGSFNIPNTSRSPSITTSKTSDSSFERSDKDIVSMDEDNENNDEELESADESYENVPDIDVTEGSLMKLLWQHFLSTTCNTLFDIEDVNVFRILCETINHLHFSNCYFLLDRIDVEIQTISEFVKRCCGEIDSFGDPELSPCQIAIVSIFAKLNKFVLAETELKLDNHLLCNSLLKPWSYAIDSQTLKPELFEALEFSVNGLVNISESIRPEDRFKLFLLWCKNADTSSDTLVDIFPLYWRLLDEHSAEKTISEIPPKFLSRLIGCCCCIATGTTGNPIWTRKDFFRFISLSMPCDSCEGRLKEIPVIKSKALMGALVEKFISIIENSEDIDSLLFLLNSSAIQFFNHVPSSNIKIIDAFLATFSLSAKANAAIHKVIPSFIKRFGSTGYHDSLLLCFKHRFGSECKNLNNQLLWSEISHIIDFGSLVDGELLVEVLVYLVRRCWEKSYIKTEIARLARYKNLTVFELFIRCQPSLSVKIIDFLTANYSESKNCGSYLITFISSFTSNSTEPNSSQVSKHVTIHIIPYLIMQRTTKSLHLLKSVVPSDLTADNDFSPLLSASWFLIVKVIVNNVKTDEIDAALKYLQDLCKAKPIKDLFVAQSVDIKTYLFCNLRSHRDSAYNLLSKLVFYENEKKRDVYPPKKLLTQKQFNEYFINNMRPFFSLLNRMLKNTNEVYNIDEKVEAFNSLVDLLNSLQKQQITAIEIPYKAALLSAFEYWKKHNHTWNKSNSDLFVQSIIDNWKSYIDKHPSLYNQVIEICNVLMPLLDINPNYTSKLYNSIIVDRSEEFFALLPDLTFLPKIPELETAHLKIQEQLRKNNENRINLATKIEQAIKNLSVDNPEVKVRHLQQLREWLRLNKHSLHQLRIPGKVESSDHVIRHLLKTLMRSCVPYENLHLVIAECLGEIGAIDPGRLELVYYENANRKVITHDVENPAFAVTLISELSSILDDKRESRIHDCVYYAIQEVLKLFLRDRELILDNLSKSLRNICQSLVNSCYDVQYDFESISSSMNNPIYNTNLKYNDWIYQWMVKLTTLVTSPQPRKLFTSCLAIVKHSCSLARFLLPFVVLYALKDADEESKKIWIIGEIQAIMKLTTGSSIESTFPYPMTSPMESKLSISTTQLVEVQHLCVQTIFSVLDSLDEWVYSTMHPLNFENRSKLGGRDKFPVQHDKIVPIAKSLSKGLLKSSLSALAFNCQSYARALRYMEKHMRCNFNEWTTIQKYYAALDDADGVEGVTAKFGENSSLMDDILAHEVKGQFQDVLSCCEKGLKVEPMNIDFAKIQVRCLMNLDSPSAASKIALGYISNNSDWKKDLAPYMVEAAWKLSSWSELDSLLEYYDSSNSETTLNVGIGKLFNFSLKGDFESFNKTLQQLRQKEMNPIAAAAMENGAYIRGYSHLVRLHMLNDLEYGLQQLFIPKDQRDMKSLLQEWRNRNSVVQSSLRFLEPVVNLQRIMVRLDDSDKNQSIQEFAKSLLLSAKISRKSGHLQKAYSFLIEAERGTEANEIPIPLRCHLIIERSKYYWAKNQQESAVIHLQKGLNSHYLKRNNGSEEAKQAYGKVKLLYATYADQTSSLKSNDLLKLYTEVLKCSSNWEEASFRVAKYYDKLLLTITEEDEKASAMVKIVKSFRDSLRQGAKHVTESVPRMLSVWFDLGSLCGSSKRKSNSTQYQIACNKLITEVIDNLLDDTPKYYYMTCFPQLLSRICHPYSNLRDSLLKLISRLMVEYPKQTFWMLVGTLNNKDNAKGKNLRRQQCEIILDRASKNNSTLKKYFTAAKELSKLFIQLSDCSQSQINSMIPKIKAVLTIVNNSSEDVKFLLPYQRLMNVRLPSKVKYSTQDESKAFAEPVYIFDIRPNIETLHSLQKPKKLTLIGSDGKDYVMMCKPKDDLRKDQRTMEFMNLVNLHLKKDPEARKRQLSIRTYTVVPLSQDCGLVEWVDDLRAVRQIIHNLYLAKGINPDAVRKYMPPSSFASMSANTRIEKFKQAMEEFYTPAVFNKFFLRNFIDPTAWYLSRLAYIRSCAVMSIVGYIIGLGDRHLENILINVVTGQLVHVDFNLLFNKGEVLNFPELVPFRLTHNMVDAMGATGYEGAFRITCETTLRVMREQIDALMSVLKPFVYDPLIDIKDDIKTPGKKTAKIEEYEVIPEQAMESVTDIEDRLKGLPRRKLNNIGDKQMGRTQISVSGQVSYLIEEATSTNKLGAMYFGWAPWF